MRSSCIQLARRTAPFLLKKSKLKSPENNLEAMEWPSVGPCSLQTGFTRYELDFIETAEWTKKLIDKLSNDKLSGKFIR
jgi:hypothetical protein